MSFKKFDSKSDISYLSKEVVVNSGEGMSFSSKTKIPNSYVVGGISGGYYIDIYNESPEYYSSTKMFTITYGYTTSSVYYSGSFNGTYQEPKLRMYRLMAKKLLGNENGKFIIGDKECRDVAFFMFSRNLYKDKLGMFVYFILNDGSGGAGLQNFIINDDDIITLTNGNGVNPVGLLFRSAGVIAWSPSMFEGGWSNMSSSYNYEVLAKGVSGTTYNDLLTGICNIVNEVDLYQRTINVKSSFYKCVAEPNEFNYSSNPSFVSLPSGEIKTTASSSYPTTYITQVGLLGENNELIAVAKLQNPIKKNPFTGVTITARIDY